MANTNLTRLIQDEAALLDAILYTPEASQPSRRGGPQRHIFMTDPPNLCFWAPGDDITLVCLSNNKAATFWAYVAEKKDDEDFITKTTRWLYSPRLAEVFEGYTLQELTGGGSLILQHAPLPAHFDASLIAAYGVPDYQDDSSPSYHAQKRLKSVQDAVSICQGSSIEQRNAYHQLRSWLENAGLLSKDFGPLHSITLLRMIYQIRESASILQTFSEVYSRADEILRIARDLISNEEASIVAKEISRLQNDISFTLEAPRTRYAARFRQDYSFYVQVRCHCWNEKNARKVRSSLYDTVKLLKEVAVTTRSFGARRLWSGPFTNIESSNPECDIMLLGITPTSCVSEADAMVVVETVIQEFTSKQYERLEGEDFRIYIEVLTAEDTQKLQLQPLSRAQDDNNVSITNSLAASRKQKLRPAGQTISLLRWHPNHQMHRYEVGYLDRFAGLKWLPLEKWGKVTEDEDFIPEHRVQQFRRANGGQIVWDRAKKLDLL